MSGLYIHRWGPETGDRIVCLHGVTSFGGHFAGLAARLSSSRVVAPDLRGFGRSTHAPPWRLADHLDDLAASLTDPGGTWIGHSFGARIAVEQAATSPDLVDRLVLLDPALQLPAPIADYAASSARRDRVYASFTEAIDARFEESQLWGAPRELLERELSDHLVEGVDGLWRYRYAQAAVIVSFSELATEPPPFTAIRVPTLVVVGSRSFLTYDHLVETHREAVGDLLEIVRVEAGHTVLWDAADATATAIANFLDRTGS